MASNKLGAADPAGGMSARGSMLAGLIGIVIGGSAVALWADRKEGAGGSRAEMEGVVRDYILANPEILPEAMERLQQRSTAETIEANRAAFETPFAGAWAGAQQGDVVLVEFFDYACGFCRKSNADVERLLREDPKLKVVWREWPVLGPNSLAAAEASLAAARADRFQEFHDRLFASGRPTPQAIVAAQQAAGITPEQVAAMRGSLQAREELERNHKLATSLNASGTPTFVIGDQLLQGAIGYEALKAAIARAREKA
ncbi:DsbA family protein [Sphingosinicella rhizophila]|uniref:DsbA family protein n=1 Tax=Sphingosinicella rhizophila TaxID=3050082 RepID=A0ABU3Q6U3_9SPHN|nr:DsbA family protein [Sphingosinicella sp. GR2756]MDT9599052.1 DsbA family protein [Sphingosinicella sp. GR2756]